MRIARGCMGVIPASDISVTVVVAPVFVVDAELFVPVAPAVFWVPTPTWEFEPLPVADGAAEYPDGNVAVAVAPADPTSVAREA